MSQLYWLRRVTPILEMQRLRFQSKPLFLVSRAEQTKKSHVAGLGGV